MKDKKIIILGLIGGLLIVVILFFVFRYFKASRQPAQNQPILSFPPLPPTTTQPIPQPISPSTTSTLTTTSTAITSVEPPKTQKFLNLRGLPLPGEIFKAEIKEINETNRSFVVVYNKNNKNQESNILTDENTRFVYLVCPKNSLDITKCWWEDASFSNLKTGIKVSIIVEKIKNEKEILAKIIEIRR